MGSHRNDFRLVAQKMETDAGGNSTLPLPVRHDACMDQDALGRLGHYIVSRRVALGYRTRTDLANSLKFTVRTLADIEHGVRPSIAVCCETAQALSSRSNRWPCQWQKPWSASS